MATEIKCSYGAKSSEPIAIVDLNLTVNDQAGTGDAASLSLSLHVPIAMPTPITCPKEMKRTTVN